MRRDPREASASPGTAAADASAEGEEPGRGSGMLKRRIGLLIAIGMIAAACSSTPANAPAATPASTTAASGAAPSTAGGATGDKVKIGFITKFPVDFYDIMVDSAKAWAQTHPDVEAVFAQGKSGTDDEGEIAAIESMVTQGVNAIVITPTSPNVQSALDKATAAGIKVVLVDNDIPGWTGKSSLVATDNLAGGKLAGSWLAAKVPPGSKIGILQGRLGNPSLDDRVKGFKQTLGSNVTVVAEPATDCDQTKGLDTTQDILAAHPDVVAIYGACGPPIIGALQAIKAARKKPGDIVVVGFDAAPDELTAIKGGDEA